MNNAAKKNLPGAFSNKGKCSKCGIMYFHGVCNSCPAEAPAVKAPAGFKGAVLEW